MLALAACPAGEAASVRKPALVPQLTITPGNGLHNVAPGAGIMVHATNGTLRAVRARSGGQPVTGRLADHSTVWQSSLPLSIGRQFTVAVTAAGTGGKTVTATSSFTTLKPKKTLRP